MEYNEYQNEEEDEDSFENSNILNQSQINKGLEQRLEQIKQNI